MHTGATENDVSEYLNLAEALQENILFFLNDLTFLESSLPDHLVSKGCLSEEESAYILSFGNRHDRIRTLIRTMKRRDSKTIYDFLEIVGNESPHLKNKVHETFNDKQNQDSKTRYLICPTCLMIKIVDLKDIIDILWKEKLVSDDLYDVVIADAERHREIVWNTILHSLNKKNTSEKKITILIKALENKYGHIANLLKGEENLCQLQCSCSRRSNRKRTRLPSASSSAQSSHTDRSASNVPRILDLLNQSSLEESSEDLEPKLEKLAETFDYSNPSRYDDPKTVQTIPKIVPEVNEYAFGLSDKNEHEEAVMRSKPDIDSDQIKKSNRKRFKSGEFIPVTYIANLAPKQDMNIFNQTDSTVVVCEADSTTNNDDEIITNLSNNVGQTKESVNLGAKTHLHGNIALDAYQVTVGRDTEYLGYDSDSNKDCEEDILEDLSSSRSNARQKELKRQFYQRQKSAPAGLTVTESRGTSQPLRANIGTHAFHSRKSKRTLKREDRRYRNMNPEKKIPMFAQESAQGNVPYNPMWNKTAQKRNTCKWGYEEAKRHNLFENKLAEFRRRESKCKSDTEMNVCDSETPDLSEYTL